MKTEVYRMLFFSYSCTQNCLLEAKPVEPVHIRQKPCYAPLAGRTLRSRSGRTATLHKLVIIQRVTSAFDRRIPLRRITEPIDRQPCTPGMAHSSLKLLLIADATKPLAFRRSQRKIDLDADGMQEDCHPNLSIVSLSDLSF